MATFAELLRRLRKDAGLSQAALAAKAGMHRFGLIKLEAGTRKPTWESVQAIAGALGVSTEVLKTDQQVDEAPAPPRMAAKRKAPKK